METCIIEISNPAWGELPISVKRCGHGAPVFLVHGWLDTSDKWSALGPYLGQYYEVWAPDLPAFLHDFAELRRRSVDLCADV